MNSPRSLLVVLSLTLLLAFCFPVSSQEVSPSDLYGEASQQFWKGEYSKSEASYRTLIEKFPDHKLYWDARYGLGKSLFKQGNLRDARPHFQAVRQNHPKKSVRGNALYSLVEVAILLDKTLRAHRLLQTFLEVFPNHVLKPTAETQLNLLSEVNRDIETASVLPRSERNRHTNRSRGSSTLEGERTGRSNPTLRPGGTDGTQARSSPPSGSKRTRNRTQTRPYPNQKSGKIEGISPQITSTGKNLIEPKVAVNTSQGRPPEKSNERTGRSIHEGSPIGKSIPEDELDRIRSLLKQGAHTKARKRLKTLLENGKPGAEAYYLAAKVYSKPPVMAQKALKYFDWALKASPEPPLKYHLAQASFLADRGRNKEAIDTLKNVDSESLNQGNPEQLSRYYYLLGELTLRKDEPDIAFFYFMDSIRSAPSSQWSDRARSIINSRL